MASLNSIYLKTETLKEIVEILEKKAQKGIEITISISDESNQYDQNISAFVSQTKEEREAKKPRFYVGNGRTFWTDGTIKVPARVDNTQQFNQPQDKQNEEEEDLPF